MLLATLVCMEWAPLGAADSAVVQRVNELVAPYRELVRAVQALTDLGHGNGWWALMAVLAIWLLLSRRVAPAVFVVVTTTGAALLTSAAKTAVGRARPVVAQPVSEAAGYAFPSGHATTSAVGVAVLLVVVLPHLPHGIRRPVAAVGVVFVAAVGASRVLLGVHWPSDVAGGWLLSSAWLLRACAVLRRHEEGRRPERAPRPSGRTAGAQRADSPTAQPVPGRRRAS